MRALERYLLLNIIDQRWREHLYDMDYLREGIHLRGFAQIDPLVAYKNEAFELFSDLMSTIWSDFARMVFNVPVEIEEAGGPGARSSPSRAARPGSSTRPGRVTYSGGGDDQPSALTAAAAANGGNGAPSATYEEDEALRGAGRAAPAQPGRADRAQRPVLVRVGQEVQEVPRQLRLGLFLAAQYPEGRDAREGIAELGRAGGARP